MQHATGPTSQADGKATNERTLIERGALIDATSNIDIDTRALTHHHQSALAQHRFIPTYLLVTQSILIISILNVKFHPYNFNMSENSEKLLIIMCHGSFANLGAIQVKKAFVM